MIQQSSNICLQKDMLYKQKHLERKKCEAYQKQHCKQACAIKTLISAEAKKLLYHNCF